MRTCTLFTVCLAVLATVHTVASAPASMTHQNAYDHLMKYGYGNSKTKVDNMRNALESYQSFMGLEKTGVFDSATQDMMLRPRCGFPDKTEDIGYDGGDDAPRQFVLNIDKISGKSRRWNDTYLTYRIDKYSTKRLSKTQIDSAIAESFKMWSDVTPLTFTPMPAGSPERVQFATSFESKDHNDKVPFDGLGNVLAHAFIPYNSSIHFDDDEILAYKESESSGTDLLNIATHEIGHALGLEHSNILGAVMHTPYAYRSDFHLHQDDIDGIRKLYGERKAVSSPHETRLSNVDNSDLCDNTTKIDAAFTAPDGSSYVFKGDKYWKLAPNMIALGYPKEIKTTWPRLPTNINAAFTDVDNKTYFFKRSEVWRYSIVANEYKLDRGFPKQIALQFAGIDSSGVDLAFIWTGNNKLYFFKGEKYYRYLIGDYSVKTKHYPQPISDWTGLPNNLDAALTYTHDGETRTYFFQGNKFYRFNDMTNQVDDHYPRLSGDMFFGCDYGGTQN